MEYTRLTEDQQRQMIEQRILQLEGEHFAHTLAAAMHDAQPPSAEVEQARTQTEAALAVIEAAHTVAVTQLETLGGPA